MVKFGLQEECIGGANGSAVIADICHFLEIGWRDDGGKGRGSAMVAGTAAKRVHCDGRRFVDRFRLLGCFAGLLHPQSDGVIEDVCKVDEGAFGGLTEGIEWGFGMGIFKGVD